MNRILHVHVLIVCKHANNVPHRSEPRDLCEGHEESSRYRNFMGWTVPWYSVPKDADDRLVADRHFGIPVSSSGAVTRSTRPNWTTGRGNEVMAPSYGLLDLAVYGRQEFWEDSPVLAAALG